MWLKHGGVQYDRITGEPEKEGEKLKEETWWTNNLKII